MVKCCKRSGECQGVREIGSGLMPSLDYWRARCGNPLGAVSPSKLMCFK
jgi:hypothetical protein